MGCTALQVRRAIIGPRHEVSLKWAIPWLPLSPMQGPRDRLAEQVASYRRYGNHTAFRIEFRLSSKLGSVLREMPWNQ